MSIKESLLVALLCMTIVMLVLACLFVLIKIFSYGITSLSKRQNTKNEIDVLPSIINTNTDIDDDYSSGDVKLSHVDERTAAMIMAIVSDESGIPLSELCFKSIKAIEKNYAIKEAIS